MLHLEFDEPVVIGRAAGPLAAQEATHHYCNAGRASDGSLIACIGMHPDRKRPPGSRVPVQLPGARHTSYLFRPHDKHPDYRWPHEYATSRSTDGGRTWSDLLPTEGHNAVACGDVTLAQQHRAWLLEPGLAVTCLLESDDGGVSWRERPDVLFRYPADLPLTPVEDDVSGTVVALNFENCNTLQVAADGSLITFATAVKRQGDVPWWFPVLFRSTDGGYNFDYVSLPCGADKPANSHGYTEPTLARLANNDLLAITRVEYHDPMRVMMQFRSADNGLTWTTPEICPGVPPVYPVRKIPVVNDGKTHLNAVAVSPDLTVLPNGIAVLTYGRPGQYLAFSEDGSGDQWRDRVAVVPEHSLFGNNDASSAMAGVTAIGQDEVLLVYDVRNYQSQALATPANTVFALKARVTRSSSAR
jgi:hypothetical protein